MKLCTDLGQSRKLTEFLPLESADMCYIKGKAHLGFLYEEYKEFGDSILQEYEPCWSLVALFSMLPKSAYLEKGSSTELCRVNLPVELKCSDWYLDPVDAAFEMICCLKENGKL